MTVKRILIVGGVAGGASCAARARRLSETAEIVIFDRGPFVSFANCGLPYYVGNVIPKEESLLVATPELFRDRFNIEVRLNTEVTAIDRGERKVRVKDLVSGAESEERYDALVLSPGAVPVRPGLPGIDLPGIFSLRTIPDSRQIKEWITRRQARRAVIVGGGYIGMEMTDNLLHLGLSVSVVEMQPQLMPLLDREMVAPIHEGLIRSGVSLYLNDTVTAFAQNPDESLQVHLQHGGALPADIVILAIGVRPEIGLARAAGLAIGERGGIRVDEWMRTSDPAIWAVGDAVEVRDVVTGADAVIPLAGPANRQGRIAADVILGREASFRGVQGTSVVGILELVAPSPDRASGRCGRSGCGPKTARSKNLPSPRPSRRLLSGREPDPPEADLPQGRRACRRRPSGRRAGRREAHRCHRHGDTDGCHRLRPGGGRALLCASVRRGQGPGQPRRDDRRPTSCGGMRGSRTGASWKTPVRCSWMCATRSSSGRITSRGAQHPAERICGPGCRSCRGTGRSWPTASWGSARTTPPARWCRTVTTSAVSAGAFRPSSAKTP